MIRVTLFGNNAMNGFSVTGHSGYAKEGNDIVCAAVSALAQAAVMGLSEIAGQNVGHSQDKGNLICTMTPGEDASKRLKAEAILSTFILGIQSIAAQYPKYVKLIQKEEASCL